MRSVREADIPLVHACQSLSAVMAAVLAAFTAAAPTAASERRGSTVRL